MRPKVPTTAAEWAAAHAELAAQPFRQLANDLYTCEQTRELRAAPGGALARLTAAMYAPAFRDWLCGVTGVALDATVDLSAARYGAGSHLLCHDDDLSERRIAFVIYLVPEGGAGGGQVMAFGTPEAVAANRDSHTGHYLQRLL